MYKREQEKKRASLRLLARKHFRYFVEWMLPNYDFSWHNELLIQKLDDFAKGKIPRLMISMPPRHGKTELGSKLLPAFMFGINPDRQIIATSYAADLATKNSREVQNYINSPLFKELFPEVFLPRAGAPSEVKGAFIRTSDEFDIIGKKSTGFGKRGGYRAAGVGGSLTGMGADVGIVDDPHKDLAEATSPTIKQGIEDWYQSTFYTRLTPEGQVLVIQTRWAEDDLSGRLLKKMKEGDEYADQWEVVSLPAISTSKRITGDPRSIEGLPLWPQRFPLARLYKIRSAVGSKVWSSLYQQDPAPAEGNSVNVQWFRRYKALPEMDYIFASWDFTFKETKTSDYVVGQVWGVKGVNKYLLHQVREKAGFTNTVKMMIDILRQYPTLREVVVEEKANGSAVIDTLKEKVAGLVPFNPGDSKVARAAAVSPQIEAGNVWLPDPNHFDVPWFDAYIDEWRYFPYGKNDDQVDATTQALLRANNSYAGWLASLSSLDTPDQDTNKIMEIFGFNNNRSSGGFGLDF